MRSKPPRAGDILDELPLLHATPRSWAVLAAERLPVFLADHAVCEQQAALTALNLIAHYPDDEELVERMASLAIEEVTHLRRVAGLLRRRRLAVAKRRPNAYAGALHGRITKTPPATCKTDRLLVAALIEARSCERFTRLLQVVEDTDPEVAGLLQELGPAEKRHWELFHRLAARNTDPPWLGRRWREWLEFERELAAGAGISPTVHG